MGIFDKSRRSRRITCPYCMRTIDKNALSYWRTELICAACGKELPPQIVSLDRNIKLGILGGSGCGKTTYITVMLQEFERELNSKLLISPMNSQTADIQKSQVGRLYRDKKILGATMRCRECDMLCPQLWQVTDRMKYNKVKKEHKVYGLTIFDFAGEDYTAWTGCVQSLVSCSDYIFLLIDPLEFTEIREQLGTKDLYFDTNEHYVETMARQLQTELRLAAGKKIDIPVAVILTKVDMIKCLMQKNNGENQQFMQNPVLSEGYIRSDAEAVDAEIRSWLKSMGESAFLSALETYFTKTRFFWVSSYGHSATNGSVETLMPHRVLDPIMWVLSEEHIL